MTIPVAAFSLKATAPGKLFHFPPFCYIGVMSPILLTPCTYQGTIRIPGSKSQTIRAVLIATFAKGRSTIHGLLHSRDTKACFHLVRSLGAKLTFSPDGSTLTIDSTALHLKEGLVLDCMNSGTTLYLASAMLATLPYRIIITGDEQLQKRPVKPLLDALSALGATCEGDHPPFAITGPLLGGSCSISCPTSQYLSALLLATPMAQSESEIDVPLLFEKPYVGLTLEWLEKQQIAYQSKPDWSHFLVKGGQCYKPVETDIPGDYSSASFFFALAAISGTTITVQGLDPQDTQGDREILKVLEAMGCEISYGKQSVTVTGPSHLHGGKFDINNIPDALPSLCVVATQCIGEVTLCNVAQARIKETDRIAVMHEELEKLGAKVQEKEDGIVIHGGKPLHKSIVNGHGDHRIIMALAILSCRVPLEIDDTSAVDVTFPTFFTLLNSLKKERR